eukprot:7048152-Alexandrium_andersonii.AAC.1
MRGFTQKLELHKFTKDAHAVAMTEMLMNDAEAMRHDERAGTRPREAPGRAGRSHQLAHAEARARASRAQAVP